MLRHQDELLTSAQIPSRTVLVEGQDSRTGASSPTNTFENNHFNKYQVSNGNDGAVTLYHFDDIRDAIESVLRGFGDKHIAGSSFASTPPPLYSPKPFAPTFQAAVAGISSQAEKNYSMLTLSTNATFNVGPVKSVFCCAVAGASLLKDKQDMQLESAVFMITLKTSSELFSDHSVQFEQIDPVIVKLKEQLETFGPVLAYSDVRRDVMTGRVFKFFGEFYRIQDANRAMKHFSSNSFDFSSNFFALTVEGVDLYNFDREALFFSPIVSTIPSSTALVPSFTPSEQLKDSQSNSLVDCADDFSSSASFDPCSNFEIDLWRIENGLDKRTTCMIRNIPNKYSQQMVLDMVNETHRGFFDFLYLRMDFKNRCNVGYAFINFTDPKYIITFAKRICGKRWARFNSDKICGLTYARIQGLENLIEKFRNSKVMYEPLSYRPKVFYSTGPFKGQEAPFPQ